MRLTLRTMLAYMDDILEPADRDDIGRKITESEFAAQLMQRIRDCIGNSRLGAPKVRSREGLDPNAVAEYLDNTLAGERVPDFERVCLQSDAELAEVASCHQILTMVLGQPAQVDPAMRARMYEIARHVAQFAPDGFVGPDSHPEWADEVQITPRSRPEIPDYLLGRTRGAAWRSILAGMVLLILLAGAVTLALGPLDHTNPIARLLGIGQKPPEAEVARDQRAEVAPKAAASAETPDAPPVAEPPPAQAESNATAASPPMAAETPSTDTESVTPKADDAAGESTGSPAGEPGTPPETAVEVMSTEQPGMQSTATVTSAPPVTPEPPAPSGDMPAPETPTAGEISSSPPTDAVAASTPAVVEEDPSADRPQAARMPNVEAPSLPPAAQVENVPIGRFLPARGVVLLIFDSQSGQWKPLTGGTPLSAGDRLLVLPTYRPVIMLSAGLTLQVPSDTLLELLPSDANGVPGVRLLFGRLVAMTTGQAGTQLRLELGPVTGEVRFVDSQATLGVELVRSHLAGTNPESEEPRVSAQLYAASGQIEWTDSNGASQTLSAPQRLVLPAVPGEAPAEESPPAIPTWIDGEQIGAIDARASAELSRALSEEKPLLLTLREMAEHRRVENKALAAQCLALLEEFDPLVKGFNDPDQRATWQAQMADMRAALARGPATAVKVREAFEKQRGEEDGRQLYRMFWGYSADDLQRGEAAKLVDSLGHESLDFRVLAFLNLQEITGKHYNYRPESPAVGREQAYRRWTDDLNRGQIVPRAK